MSYVVPVQLRTSGGEGLTGLNRFNRLLAGELKDELTESELHVLEKQFAQHELVAPTRFPSRNHHGEACFRCLSTGRLDEAKLETPYGC